MKKVNIHSKTILMAIVILSIVLSACAGSDSSSAEIQGTREALEATQTAMVMQSTAEALKLTQTALAGPAQVQPTLPVLPTAEPVSKMEATLPPTATSAPLDTPTAMVMVVTATPLTATEAPTAASTGSASSGSGSAAATPQRGEEAIRVINNSGKTFKIVLTCSGGPCQGKNPSTYSKSFGQGEYHFYVWPGRYKITWTICGKTTTFEHALNGQWYIKLSKCQ